MSKTMNVALTIKGQTMVLTDEDLHNVLDAIKYASRNERDKGPQTFGSVQVDSVRYGLPGAKTMADTRYQAGKQMFNGRLLEVDEHGNVLADC